MTDVIDDSYLGSGKLLRAAIKKYGKETFYREVIAVFDNAKDMNYLEVRLVRSHSEETRARMKETYNKIQHQSGSTNSQYGLQWICHPELPDRKIPKSEPIPDGWQAGRKSYLNPPTKLT